MTNILIFDTETTGLPDFRKPVDDPRQPHIVQLAALLCDEDGMEKASLNLIVNAGVEVPEQASSVHGITTDIMQTFGVEPRRAAAAFDGLCNVADLIVAHNIKFDKFLLASLFARSTGLASPAGSKLAECTMEMSSPIVNLPPSERMIAAGIDKPKPPRLEEAYRCFFGKDLEGAHDALVDVRACKEIYFRLKELGETAA